MSPVNMNEQSLHFGVFAGVVNSVMDGRLLASAEYHDLLSTLASRPLSETKVERREEILAEVASRSTPMMSELMQVLVADWADQDAHYEKYRNRPRDRFATVRRLRKKTAAMAASRGTT